jgi:hypothetical protein
MVFIIKTYWTETFYSTHVMFSNVFSVLFIFSGICFTGRHFQPACLFPPSHSTCLNGQSKCQNILNTFQDQIRNFIQCCGSWFWIRIQGEKPCTLFVQILFLNRNQEIVETRDAPYNVFAGYPSNPKTGYRISGAGRILDLTAIFLVKYQVNF